jgi:hypothetical protein
MSQNLGNVDRVVRVIAAVALFILAITLPVPLLAQVAMGLNGVYLLGSSVVGTCLGYKLMGVSTCPVKQQRAGA